MPQTLRSAYPDAVLDLPRSARLAAWGTAALRGLADDAAAVAAVCRDDEPHRAAAAGDGAVVGLLGSCPDLAALLGDLRALGCSGLRAVLPVPGDLLGLPGPPAFNVEATDAGEAVLTAGPVAPVGLVPEVVEFGSPWEPGASVTWRVHAVLERPSPETGTLAEAERALREALAEATAVLAGLDVARWREDAAERIAAVRDGGLVRDAVPAGTAPRAVRVLASAARVRAIVALAGEDDGAALTGHEAGRRRSALREVDGVARRSLVVALNAAVDEPADHADRQASTER